MPPYVLQRLFDHLPSRLSINIRDDWAPWRDSVQGSLSLLPVDLEEMTTMRSLRKSMLAVGLAMIRTSWFGGTDTGADVGPLLVGAQCPDYTEFSQVRSPSVISQPKYSPTSSHPPLIGIVHRHHKATLPQVHWRFRSCALPRNAGRSTALQSNASSRI